MAETKTCPKCGAGLPADAPSGICPKCLMLAGLDSDQDSEAEPAGVEKTVIAPPSSGFVPPELDALAPHFPQLELIELLGHGGMGAVYKARQTKLDRFVALKIIKPDTADDPTFAERFMREARTLARLGHSNIVAIHDFGEANVVLGDGREDGSAGTQPQPLYYFIMEYVDGADLRQLLESQELKPEQALAIVPQICEALQFAHDEGVVHRDIKPENILVDSRGRVKIADFGLARLVASSPQDFTLTGTHQVMGTPRYMAPEQMTGSHSVDHRADIYSLGVVFYEMLTGEVPMGQFEPPSKKVEIDVRLDEVVLRSLAKEPERRYQHASDVKTDVEFISRTEKVTAKTPARVSGLPHSRQWPIGTICLCTLVFIASFMPWTGEGMLTAWNSNYEHFDWTGDVVVPNWLVPIAALVAIAFAVMRTLGISRATWPVTVTLAYGLLHAIAAAFDDLASYRQGVGIGIVLTTGSFVFLLFTNLGPTIKTAVKWTGGYFVASFMNVLLTLKVFLPLAWLEILHNDVIMAALGLTGVTSVLLFLLVGLSKGIRSSLAKAIKSLGAGTFRVRFAVQWLCIIFLSLLVPPTLFSICMFVAPPWGVAHVAHPILEYPVVASLAVAVSTLIVATTVFLVLWLWPKTPVVSNRV